MKIHSFSNDVIGQSDGVAIAKLLQKKEINTTEVVLACIERANKVNPFINAIAFKNFEKAKEISSHDNLNGFFAGLPIFFKDMIEIKGIPVTYGSEALKDSFAPKKNDKLAEQILQMGFVNLGMSTMPEFGFICSTEFPHLPNTKNPWNTDFSCGGSSGGAGALVAAGVIPIAHSADGGGSTRIPANCCGLVGLKPTRGRILPSKLLESQMHQIAIDGVVTRTVRDTVAFYQEAEKYYHNKKLQKIGSVTPNQKKLRIGITTNHVKQSCDKKTIEAFEKTILQLEKLGHELKPVQLPINDKIKEYFELIWASSGFGVKNFGKWMFRKKYDPKKLTEFTKGLSNYFSKRIFQTPQMLYHLRKTTKDFDLFMTQEKIDILLTPTMGHVTPAIGHINMHMDFETSMTRMKKWACFTPLANANGCPSINLPLQHDEENDLPIGMLFWSNYGKEKLLLELSYQIEEAFPWKKINT